MKTAYTHDVGWWLASATTTDASTLHESRKFPLFRVAELGGQWGAHLTTPPSAPFPCFLRGFDVVIAPFEFDAYSIVLNEVAPGDVPELSPFLPLLNTWMLVGSAEAALEIQAIRRALALRRPRSPALESVEDDQSIEAVAVYALRV